jgi:hypothetical protein
MEENVYCAVADANRTARSGDPNPGGERVKEGRMTSSALCLKRQLTPRIGITQPQQCLGDAVLFRRNRHCHPR